MASLFIMDYLPVTLEDDGPPRAPPSSEIPTLGSPTQPSGILSITADTPLSDAVRKALQSYYYDLSWDVPFPRHPSAPLLYYPDALQQLRWSSKGLGVMECEIEMLSKGLLDKIPLGYYPLKVDEVLRGLEAAERMQAQLKRIQAEQGARGELERVVWRPEEVNPDLDAKDLALLDTDVDKSLDLQRNLPSVSILLKFPTYTETSGGRGESSPDQRHATRLNRVVPLLPRTPGSSEADGPISSPLLDAALREGSPDETASHLAIGSAAAAAEVPANRAATWDKDVHSAFRLARSVDEHYSEFLYSLGIKKLGLDTKQSKEHLKCTIQLWGALNQPKYFTMERQREVWAQICHFSKNYGGPGAASSNLEQLLQSLRGLKVPDFLTVWRPLLSEYVRLLDEYVSSEEGTPLPPEKVAERVASRLASLSFDDDELVPVSQAKSGNPFLQLRGVSVGKCLQRNSATWFSGNQPVPIFPVSVTPVFPAGYEEAAEKLRAEGGRVEELDLDFLAEFHAETPLEHVVLSGAVIPDTKSTSQGPHVLINGRNFLCADSHSLADAYAVASCLSPANSTPEIPPDCAVLYHPIPENTFEPLYVDESNTSSYVFQRFDPLKNLDEKSGEKRSIGRRGRNAFSPPRHSAHPIVDGTSSEGLWDRVCAAASRGAVGLDGGVLTYHRIGCRSEYHKALQPEKLPVEQYALWFSKTEEGQQEEAPAQAAASQETIGVKRERDRASQEEGERRPQAVKFETP